ncbi:hypothetical protein P9228_18575 [Mesorhizobium sp. WSM4898]|uniref:hypothetical protein n=1 Tax=Mesorhizobium sp. WSM4898 TaxID=3038544 RepID=UPI002414E138|nr:hypothetical protein [Mesorhizobium sp. WSM4898]MDG4908433.1 hypothetical protein [Mesorhizobium sp. WSM4898]
MFVMPGRNELTEASSLRSRLKLLKAKGLAPLLISSFVTLLVTFGSLTQINSFIAPNHQPFVGAPPKTDKLLEETMILLLTQQQELDTAKELLVKAKAKAAAAEEDDRNKTVAENKKENSGSVAMVVAAESEISSLLYEIQFNVAMAREKNDLLLTMNDRIKTLGSREFSIIPAAYAENAINGDRISNGEEALKANLRGFVYVGMVIALLVLLIMCTGAIFFTSSEKVFSFSVDTIKTLVGFFIGVLSSLFGLPSA